MKHRKELQERLKQKSTEIGCAFERTFSKGAGYPENETIPDAGKCLGQRKPYLGKIKGHRKKITLRTKTLPFRKSLLFQKIPDPEAGSSPEEMEEFFKTEGKENEKNTEEFFFTGEEAGTSVLHPQISKEDEWLYSQPRRFAKKPADEPKN